MEEMLQVVTVDAGNADKVATIFRVLYGEDFPVRDVYQPEVLWREIEAGRLAAALARFQRSCVRSVRFFLRTLQ